MRVFGCEITEMAVNSTRVDRSQRMTSPLVEDGFSGRQNRLNKMIVFYYNIKETEQYHCFA